MSLGIEYVVSEEPVFGSKKGMCQDKKVLSVNAVSSLYYSRKIGGDISLGRN